MPAHVSTASDTPQTPARTAGLLIAGAAILMVLVMAHHPVPRVHDTEHLMQELVSDGPWSAAVHGGLIGLMGVLLVGFTGLADRLGWHRFSVRAGLLAYAVGCAAMVVAALSDGFVLPALAAQGVRDAGQTFEASFRLLFLGLNVAARVGVLGLSLAVGLWSFELIRRARGRSLVGWLGVAASVLPLFLVVTGRLSIDFHSMLAFVVSQAAWYLALGIAMIRHRV